jgi:GNAT superfamily N-acetyltransferase
MNIRHLDEADYDPIIAVIDDWWGSRKISHLLPRIFFIHFSSTSFAIEEEGTVLGFLAGFVSQTYPDQGYIHFVAVHPDHRRGGLGRQLYSTFLEKVRRIGCTTVRSITSPLNAESIAFHMRMDFEVERVTGEWQGVPCTVNYELNGEPRVLFVKSFSRRTLAR